MLQSSNSSVGAFPTITSTAILAKNCCHASCSCVDALAYKSNLQPYETSGFQILKFTWCWSIARPWFCTKDYPPVTCVTSIFNLQLKSVDGSFDKTQDPATRRPKQLSFRYWHWSYKPLNPNQTANLRLALQAQQGTWKKTDPHHEIIRA